MCSHFIFTKQTQVPLLLGGAGTIELLTTQSISDYYNMNAGWKFCGAGYTGTDLPQKASCFVEFKKQGTHSGLQILYYIGNVTMTYIRTHSGTSQEGSSWSPWQRIDNFNCNTPADLASLLGGILLGAGNITAGMNTDNVLNITQGTWLFLGGTSPTLNSPDPKKWFYAVAFKVHNNGKLLVFAVESNNASAYYTTIGTTDTSVTWKQIQVLS